MPVWFTVEEERPDIGTVIFQADDYYERLQHITGVWNENRFLYYDMARSSKGRYYFKEEDEPVSKIFQVTDIENIPTLLAFLERANLKGVLPAAMVDFMYDLHRLYVRKMCEYGYSTRRMSKKEYDLQENNEKWTRLVKATEELRLFNLKEASDAKKRKRKLLSVNQHTYTRIDNLPTRKKDHGHASAKPKGRSTIVENKDVLHLDKNNKMMRLGGGKLRTFYIKNDYENPFAWDFGKTRLYDRRHVRNTGKHIEFTRFYHKIAKALRFAKSEPIDWRTISMEEVDKHRYLSDCWMVIKGRVYDVTSYLKSHPGGSSFIMQGAGIDATEVFVSVHPYVVFYNHLQRLQIGTVEDFQEHYHTEWEPPAYFDIFRILKEWILKPTHPLAKYKPTVHFEQNNTYYCYSISFPSSLKSSQSDWTVTIRKGFEVTIIKFVEQPFVWYGGFDLKSSVMDDTVYRWFSDDCNTLELKIAKPYEVRVRKPIKDWRLDNGFFLSSYSLKDMFRVSVVERSKLADGVKLYGICVGLNKYFGCPLGSYVNLRILDQTRPYTPVCLPDEYENKYVDDSAEFQTIYFVIKEFKDGDFTSMLHYLPIKKILKDVDLYMSPPMGNFSPDFLFTNMDVMLLIAGGTGIAPMTRIIQEYIQHKEKIMGTTVCLLYFAQHREDLIWSDVWRDLDKKHRWFHFFYSLTRVYRFAVDKHEDGNEKRGSTDSGDKSERYGRKSGKKSRRDLPRLIEFQPSEKKELYGYPSANKLKFIFDGLKGVKDTKFHKAIVCGPYGFNHSCKQVLKEFGKHKEEDIYFFAG